MVKKRFLIAFLLSFALLFATLAGCDMSTTNPTSSSESESVLDTESLTDSQGDSYFESEESDVGDSEESLSESEESVSESDSSAAVTVPTFNFSLTSTETSITIVEEENDPSDVGEITAIEFSLGNDKINVEDLSQREFNGLYSGEQYTVKITYTYNIGDGDVSDTYPKSKYTVAMRVPSVSATYTAESETSISFELEIDDKSNNMTITAIKLVSEDGGEEIYLDDLTSRIFEDVPTGQYELVVCYDYDLNKGEGLNSAEYRLSVATVISPLSIPDFTVEVEEGRNPVILQLSDTQIIDAMQARSGRAVDKTYYAPERMEDRLFKFLRETITSTNPDLILITGDLVYGEFDDAGTSLLALIEAMDSFQIPWAPVFGNHDNESKMGADWQCEQLENSEYCLFKQRTLTGNGNYTVGIVQGDKLTRVFFMMDSNGCGAVSAESLANGHTTSSVGFGNDQIAWFEEVGARINELSPDTKISFAFHINISMFKNAYKKYGFTNSGTKDNPINIDLHPDKEDGDFGYLGADLKGPWDPNFVVYRKMVAIGCDSIYIGHEHLNSASVVYEGVRFQFSQKISTYDRCNWLTPDGEVVGSYPPFSGGKEIMGGTVNVLDETGAIVDAYIYYCDGVDPTVKPEPPLEVSGLQYDTDLTIDGNLSLARVAIAGYNAYEITAVGQGKFYVKSALLANKSTFSFTVYIPSTSKNLLNGYGEFAIRVKPNANEPVIDGTVDGYIKYMSKENKADVLPELELVYDQWATYTVDISSLGTSCTEWAFVIAQGNVIYFRDITIS